MDPHTDQSQGFDDEDRPDDMSAEPGSSDDGRAKSPNLSIGLSVALVALIAVFFYLNSISGSSIAGAFGLQLGTAFDTAGSEPDSYSEGFAVFNIRPDQPEDLFERYTIKTTKKTGLIISISGKGMYQQARLDDNFAACKRDLETLKQRIAKFGNIEAMDYKEHYRVSSGGRQITISCAQAIYGAVGSRAVRLMLLYEDRQLYRRHKE